MNQTGARFTRKPTLTGVVDGGRTLSPVVIRLGRFIQGVLWKIILWIELRISGRICP